jgi:hypothetical protein
MNGIRKGLATAGFLAAMFGGGAIGAVAFGATGGGSSTTATTTTPSIQVAPSTGTTTTPSQGAAPGPGAAPDGRDCPDHDAGASGAGSSATF